MKMIVYGSSALKYHFPLDYPREPNDLDILIEQKGVRSNLSKVEYKCIPLILALYPDGDSIISKEHLLTLKVSHVFWDIKWEKTMYDIQYLIKKGVKIDYKLFYELYEYWKTVHPKNRRSDLTLSRDDFFRNKLAKIYDHDYLHELLVYPDTPMYKKVLKDGKDVEPDEEKYLNFTYEEKVKLVREEIYVMAYERGNKLDFRTAYAKMIKKFIIGHAPLWEALFIIENFATLAIPEFDYINKLNKELTYERKTIPEFA